MIDIALGLYTAGLVLVLAFRAFTQLASASAAGRGRAHHRPGPLGLTVATLLALSVVGALAALWLTSRGSITPWDLPPDVELVGVVLEALGFIGIYLAQESMGRSWRFGLDPTEKITLVTKGVFSRVRHPVYTAMVVAQVGVLLVAPHPVSVLAVVALVLAVQVQARAIEEPHLLRHSRGYGEYAARTGRFVPGVGRIASARR